MKYTRCFVLVLFLISNKLSLYSQGNDPVNSVNPFLGTEFFGHTYPGAALPFGMVHLSPDAGTKGWTYGAGYTYSDNSIIGFSHSHWSGVGMVNGGEILLMPVVNNKLQVVPGTSENPDEGYRSRFDHNDEEASPGYYSVGLKDYNVRVELTTTLRAGFHRYTFPESENSKIILDLGHQIGTMSSDYISRLVIVNDSCIEGEKGSGLGRIFFRAEFSKPFRYYGTFDSRYVTPESQGSIFPYKNAEVGEKIGAFVTYKTHEGEHVMVKIGISYTSVEGARKNLSAEIPGWDFDLIRKEARDIWAGELSKIIIAGAGPEQKEIFYTAMYHALLSQYISQDVDGKYYGMDGKIHTASGFDYYGSFSCWDTYRTEHPLLTLVAPERINDIVKSIVSSTKDWGWLPAQHFLNIPGQGMVADHLVPIITDAYMKGFRNFDAEYIYKSMVTKALESPSPPLPPNIGRPGVEYLSSLGYLPVDKISESVSNTLEITYDDWCIAQFAKALGKEKDYLNFMNRAGNYKNLWDSETQFMRPRKSDGTWLEQIAGRTQEIIHDGEHTYYRYFDPLLVGRRPNRHYTESNAWQYIWSVQHDIQGLIRLFGSKSSFTGKLDAFFEMSPVITPPKYVGVVGTTGQYVHGNQPSHHVAYLYNYAGEPWKTQQRVRQVTETLYRSGPGGLCGNEDMGSLSSWYIFSSLGFYPVAPGSNIYVIGSPLFNKATLHLAQGKTFIVEARDNSKTNKYIQSASLNGKPISRTWLTHDEITNGGIIMFQMGPLPNKKWGNKPDDAPQSMTSK